MAVQRALVVLLFRFQFLVLSMLSQASACLMNLLLLIKMIVLALEWYFVIWCAY